VIRLFGSSNFLVFNESLLNVQDDPTYTADTTRISGLNNGIASTVLHNKLFRQVSIMAAALGELISTQGRIASDANLNLLSQELQKSIVTTGADNKATKNINSILIDVDTRTVTINRSGGEINGITIKDPTDNSVVEEIVINRTSGLLSSIQKTVGSKVIAYTVVRDGGGLISGITKNVT